MAKRTSSRGLLIPTSSGFNFFRMSTVHIPRNRTKGKPIQFPEGEYIYRRLADYSVDWRWLNKLSYTTTINHIHDISAFAGYEIHEFTARSYAGQVNNILFPTGSTEYLGNGTTYPNIPVFGGGDKYTGISSFASVNYSLLDKYLLYETGRRDGTSKFGPAEEYGNFGAISGGWRISKEAFLEKVTWLNDLKLRASYGTAGNDAVPSGKYLTTLARDNFGNYDLGGTNTTSMNGYYTYQLGNPQLHWESNKTTNIGFDASFFHNSLTASFNWYNRITDGLIYEPPAPGTAGSALGPFENIMNFSNKGIELELTYTTAYRRC